MKNIIALILTIWTSIALAGNTIRVASFNIYMKPDPLNSSYSNQRAREICKVLKDSNHPHNKNWDVVLIQEAWTMSVRGLLKKCGYPHVLDMIRGKSGIHRHRRGGIKIPINRKGEELNVDSGLMILSKHPIVAKKRHNFSVNGRLLNIFKDGEVLASKSLYMAKIKVPGQKGIWIANTHLAANYCLTADRSDCESYEDHRKIQIDEIARYTKFLALEHPVILGGDLNTGPQPVAIDKLWRQLGSILGGFSQGHYDQSIVTSAEANFFNQHDHGKLDHLFGSRHFEIKAAGLCFEQTFKTADQPRMNYSDHYGWQADFSLKDLSKIKTEKFSK